MIYITYYTTPDDLRKSSPAANNKTISISKALAKNGINVDILSTCTVAKNGKFIKGRKFKVLEDVSCKQYSLYNTSFGPFRRLQYYIANVRVFLTLLFKAKKNENVLFYHAIERSFPILLAKKIKKFRLILEVEEIYADVKRLSKKYIQAEKKCFNMADAYIFPTKLLNEKINLLNKPYCVIHGSYEPEEILSPKKDDKIHVVYAGTFEEDKGALEAIGAALNLDENYHIHILGFGSDEQIANIKKTISSVIQKTTCEVSYDGCLFGKEFICFLQSCHIGLCTQNPKAKFTDTSFPSKILTYLANGLDVLTIRIPSIESSDINEYMNYYENQTPEEIAAAIKSVKITDSEISRTVILELNKKFTKEIVSILHD